MSSLSVRPADLSSLVPSHDAAARLAARCGAAALLALGLLAPAAAAQDFDASVLEIEVNQAIQTGTTKLAAGRATFVRAEVRVLNPPTTPLPVDGILRVYVGGVELAGSPYYSDNGPFPAESVADLSTEEGTLNFIVLAPLANDVVLSVEVNPSGPNFVPESLTANNVTLTGELDFLYQRTAELAYAPIDYRPGGGSVPNLPDPALIEPGMGDNFVEGIYPTPDWNYHRTDAPSKLWTSSLAASGSDLLTSLQVDKALMAPEPDFLYGWVPGGLSYNGQSVIGGDVAMGNTELIRYQRTLAHELGHNFGLQHNTLTTGLVGIDVEEHLHLTQGLGLIKAATLKDIMYAGLLTPDAWVASPSYNVFFNHPVFDATGTLAGDAATERLLIAGQWNTATGALAASDVLRLPPGKTTTPVPLREADLVVRAFSGTTLVAELPMSASNSTDECAACRGDSDSQQPASPLIGFAARLPVPAGAVIDRVLVEQAGARKAAALELRATPSAPQLAFTQPAGGALAGDQVHLAWSAADADGDALQFYLRYSPDGGQRFVPLASGLTATELDVDLAQLPALDDGQGFFELLASDGLHTTVVHSEKLSALESPAGAAGNAPWVQVLTPDDGFTVLRGATLILHSSGWDLEDHALTGASLAWSSDVAGVLGTGRLLSVASLAPGTHVITVTATDSGGLQASDSATITIVDRALPAVGETCQADIGFGGPGTAQLAVCGGDLSTGTTADVSLTGAPPNSPGLLLIGTVNAPTAFKGGLLLPLPAQLLVALVTDGAGDVELPGLPGGGGPLSVYLQAIVADAGQPQGIGISNAVQVQILP